MTWLHGKLPLTMDYVARGSLQGQNVWGQGYIYEMREKYVKFIINLSLLSRRDKLPSIKRGMARKSNLDEIYKSFFFLYIYIVIMVSSGVFVKLHVNIYMKYY